MRQVNDRTLPIMNNNNVVIINFFIFCNNINNKAINLYVYYVNYLPIHFGDCDFKMFTTVHCNYVKCYLCLRNLFITTFYKLFDVL